MNTPEDFFHRLSGLLRERGLTQDDLAKAMGTRQSTVSHWVQGVSLPRPRTMREIADYFRVQLKWLESGAGPQALPEKQIGRASEAETATDRVEEWHSIAKMHGRPWIWQMADDALSRIAIAVERQVPPAPGDVTSIAFALQFFKPPEVDTSEAGPKGNPAVPPPA